MQTEIGVLAHLARAFDWQSKGNRFDSDILHKAVLTTAFFIKGVVAHLVEHLVRNQKVVGSSPIYSTKKETISVLSFFCFEAGTKVLGCRQSRRHTTSPIYSTRLLKNGFFVKKHY